MRIPAAALDEERRRLRSRLHELLTRARENERKEARVAALEDRLIAATGLRALCEALLVDLPRDTRLHEAGLLLRDTGGELAEQLAFVFPAGLPAGLTLLEHDAAPGDLARLYLGRYQAERHAQWFADPPEGGSVALLPLLRGRALLGRLHFASLDPGRYTPDVGTHFLQRLARVTAVCLENAINVQRIAQAGMTDPLTGLRNRRYFQQRLGEEVATAARRDLPLAALFIDIDHFKGINDTQGHAMGDAVLVEVARRIEGALRRADLLARYGGEEFVALLPATDLQAAVEIAERVRAAVSGLPCAQGALRVTVSLGLAASTPPWSDEIGEGVGEDLLRRADAALFEAKRQGRNRVVGGY